MKIEILFIDHPLGYYGDVYEISYGPEKQIWKPGYVTHSNATIKDAMSKWQDIKLSKRESKLIFNKAKGSRKITRVGCALLGKYANCYFSEGNLNFDYDYDYEYQYSL